MLEDRLKPSNVLPFDHRRGVLVGRVWIDGLGAVLVQVRDDGLFDLSDVAATCSALMELDYPAQAVRNSAGARLGDTAAVLANSAWNRREKSMPWFLAPIDLQAIKAAGVTFVSSMLERVIEEQARGDPGRAEDIRKAVVAAVGDDLAKVVPGSPEADKVKQALTVKSGVDSDNAKKIQAAIKQSKMKVQAAIQGDTVRVSGAKRDDLQLAMQLIKKTVPDAPVSFTNLRD